MCVPLANIEGPAPKAIIYTSVALVKCENTRGLHIYSELRRLLSSIVRPSPEDESESKQPRTTKSTWAHEMMKKKRYVCKLVIQPLLPSSARGWQVCLSSVPLFRK